MDLYSLNSILLPGATYTITGEVMLIPGETATNANFTILRHDPLCVVLMASRSEMQRSMWRSRCTRTSI
jgi:hypothetical protein